jgi:lipopolysaccharide/colanic/teichoic acid biosynthesis glycosyltransferase
MVHDERGANGRQVWAHPDDPRVTPVGRMLRKYRLDELPQLFNVLQGDMNLVGPRPEQPKIFEDLRRVIKGYEVRQRVRPGITGWAQINRPYDQSLEDVVHKVELDIEYIRHRSLLKDVRIMLETVPVMVLRRGAW